MDLIQQGKFDHMVSYNNNHTVRNVPIIYAVDRLRLVLPDGQTVQTVRALDIFFGE